MTVPADDTGTCAWCREKYTSTARPQWAIGRDGKITGTVHERHADAWRQANGVSRDHTFPTTDSAAEAHRRWWLGSRGTGGSWIVDELFRRPFDRSGTLKRWASATSAPDRESIMAEVKRLDEQYREEFARYHDIFALAEGVCRPRYGRTRN